MKNVLIILILMGFTATAWGQGVYPMANQTVTDCSGSFQSSGLFQQGPAGLPGYSNNESYTMTFCPSGNGVMNMNFTSFVLGVGDVLTVYNGNSTAASIIGVYDATNPLIGNITAVTSSNPSGCLTFSFISDSADISNGWFAYLACDTPCQAFDIQLANSIPDTSIGGYIDLCELDTATIEITGNYYNNNQNYYQSDATTTFEWRLDSIPFDSGSTLSYYPDSVGALLLQVYATDSLGCEADYNLNYWVRVATPPDFTGYQIPSDTFCFEDTVFIDLGVESVSWTNGDSTSNAPTTYLPDGSGTSPGVYDNTLTFSKFGTGDTISSVSQITKFWMVMEHSFLGDLSITMTCPNGSVTTLKQFPGGGGRWLGEACDNNLTATPGIGYLYEWRPTGNTLTDMNAHSGACVGCPVVANPCGGWTGTTLQSSSYDAIGTTFNNMIGCPLNGTWTLTITDQWAIDNGYLFTWGVDFDSALYPATVITYDPGIDSLWLDSLPNVNVVQTNSDSAVVVPLDDDTTYCYTLHVLDDFGCEHDSTLCFYVRDRCDPACYQPIAPNRGEKQVSCTGGSDGYVWAAPSNVFIPMPWTYTWKDAAGTILQTSVFSTTPDTLFNLPVGTYTVEIIDGNGCFSSWTKSVTLANQMIVTVGGATSTQCANGACDGQATAIVFYGQTPYSYLWSSGDTNQTATTLCPGLNTVYITDANGCMDSNTVTVGVPDPVAVSGVGDSLICYGTSTNISAIASGGTPPYSYSWSMGAGTTQMVSVGPNVDQVYTVVATDSRNCPPDSATVLVQVRPPLTSSIVPVDTVCEGDEINLQITGYGGDSNYTFTWDNIGVGSSVLTFAGPNSQYYLVTVTDGCGTIPYVDSVFVQVGGYPQLDVFTIDDDTICEGDGYILSAEADGGDGKFTYEWDNGLGFGKKHLVDPQVSTLYTVTVTDQCNTPAGIGQVMVVVGGYPEPTLMVDEIEKCDPASFNFALDTSDIRFSYQLDFGAGWQAVDLMDSVKYEYTIDGCHDVALRVVTHLGCEFTKEYPCMIKVINRPTAKFDFESHYPNEIEHVVDFWDQSSSDVVSWTWWMMDTVISDRPRFAAALPDAGLHYVKLVVANQFGCQDSADINIDVAEVPTYFIPTAFTPGNGDDLNNTFNIIGTKLLPDDFLMEIYDRWGTIVYKTSSLSQGWDGKSFNTGKPLPSGQYVYRIYFTLHTGLKTSETGEVTLIR